VAAAAVEAAACGSKVGLETAGGLMTVLIERNTDIPTDKGHTFNKEFSEESVQSQVEELLGYFTLAPGSLVEAEVRAFKDFWCEADFAKYMSPEQADVAMEVQRVLRVVQDRSGSVGEVSISGVSAGSCSGRSTESVSDVMTSAGSDDSCSNRSSSGSSSRRLFPPRSPGVLDPLADLLTAGDEPAFVALAKQMLPSDWLQRTFRQRKRYLGTLRRSYFGGQVSGAGSPLLQAG
jgi:hypothetical protein